MNRPLSLLINDFVIGVRQFFQKSINIETVNETTNYNCKPHSESRQS